jgi:hypothetical protein
VADPELQQPDAGYPGSSRGILLAEDDALKELMSGITVMDDRRGARRGGTRPVSTHFRWPEGSREHLYPFITIDFINVVHDREREISMQKVYARHVDVTGDPNAYLADVSILPYWPSTYSDIADHPAVTSPDEYHELIEMTPVQLVYQISTHARNWQHDRQLMSYIMQHRIPFRHGWLHVAADDTSRRLVNLGAQSSNYIDNDTGGQKPVFRKVWTVTISAEYSSQQLRQIATVLSVNLELTGFQDPAT